jgi:hypothetical protein
MIRLPAPVETGPAGFFLADAPAPILGILSPIM